MVGFGVALLEVMFGEVDMLSVYNWKFLYRRGGIYW